MNTYQKRDKRLKRMGFACYADYLRSQTWYEIRSKVFARARNRCEVCGARAEVVHHRDYLTDTLAGLNLDGLVALCHVCHKDADMMPQAGRWARIGRDKQGTKRKKVRRANRTTTRG